MTSGERSGVPCVAAGATPQPGPLSKGLRLSDCAKRPSDLPHQVASRPAAPAAESAAARGSVGAAGTSAGPEWAAHTPAGGAPSSRFPPDVLTAPPTHFAIVRRVSQHPDFRIKAEMG